MKFIALLAATAATVVAVPAMAQSRDTSQDFNGGYIAVVGGKSLQSNRIGETLVFDTNGDGNFNDTVRTGLGANAFATGFCDGGARRSTPTGCRNDRDGAEYYARVGYDQRMGNIVIGALIEGGRNESIDAVSGYDGTYSYTMSRKAKWNAGARLRAGYTPDGGALFYVTGGGAYTRLNNSFETTNSVNPVRTNGNSNAWGWAAGGGGEVMLAQNLSLGLEYLYTDVSNNDFVANLGPASAPNLGEFVTPAGGIDVQRSRQNFRNHSVRGSLNFRF